jgi:Zn-dependent protease
MMPTRQGAFRLFRFAGIDVFLHWSWFLIAAYEISTGSQRYSSPVWNALEYVALFGIVTMHEFGHALACRSVGGRANQIVLWPLGGVAYVDPPARPGAVFWSIAAGPLVNVALVPVFLVLGIVSRSSGFADAAPNVHLLLRNVALINYVLLVFNMLPVYPLDGGQILRALLWFPLGRAKSLMVAAIIGFVGVAGLAVLALWSQSVWLGILAAFAGMRCWAGYQQAQALTRLAEAPRHEGFACPSCKAAPPKGALWVCGKCRTAFDTFETHAVCPKCGAQFQQTRCLECGTMSPISEWAPSVPVPPPLTPNSGS